MIFCGEFSSGVSIRYSVFPAAIEQHIKVVGT